MAVLIKKMSAADSPSVGAAKTPKNINIDEINGDAIFLYILNSFNLLGDENQGVLNYKCVKYFIKIKLF